MSRFPSHEMTSFLSVQIKLLYSPHKLCKNEVKFNVREIVLNKFYTPFIFLTASGSTIPLAKQKKVQLFYTVRAETNTPVVLVQPPAVTLLPPVVTLLPSAVTLLPPAVILLPPAVCLKVQVDCFGAIA